MIELRKAVALSLCFFLSSAWAQQPAAEINPARPSAPIFWRPSIAGRGGPGPARQFRAPPESYSRGQALPDGTGCDCTGAREQYRYRIGPVRFERMAPRARRGRRSIACVPTGASQTSSVASGQGVLGSQAAAGITGGNNGGTPSTSNVTVTQVGTVAQTYDPTIQEATTFQPSLSAAAERGREREYGSDSGAANLHRLVSGRLRHGRLGKHQLQQSLP